MNAELGMIEAEDDRFRLTLVRRLSARIGAVWAALTEPDELSAWLGDVEFEPREGAELCIDFGGDKVRGRVRSFEAPHVFEFSWSDSRDDPDPSVVRFELETDGDETILTLCHSRQGRRLAGSTAAGWHAHLDVLDGRLAGRPREWSDCYKLSRERYAPLVRAAMG